MTKIKINFTEEKYGYSQAEVDDYIERIGREYEKAFNEYQRLRDKYNNLLDDCRKLETQEKTGPDADVITKTLLNAEILAQKIISDAKAEAAVIKTEAQKILDGARDESFGLVIGIKRDVEQAHRIMAQAAGEVQRLLG